MIPVRVISWITGYRIRPGHELVAMEADVALLEDSCSPPGDLLPHIEPETGDLWTLREKGDYNCWPMVVKLSDRVEIERFTRIRPFSSVDSDETAVSGTGTSALARITPLGGFHVCARDHAAAVGQDDLVAPAPYRICPCS